MKLVDGERWADCGQDLATLPKMAIPPSPSLGDLWKTTRSPTVTVVPFVPKVSYNLPLTEEVAGLTYARFRSAG
jgi:hypothetical protein